MNPCELERAVMMKCVSSCIATVAFLLVGVCATYAKEPAEDLDGPPVVSCHSWGIADGKTGELLWGEEVDTPRKSASTTKLMCAYVILEFAKEHPDVLHEMVTFSQLADRTDGSTADVREGESVPVRECLYGLLLPSGNDAGNALAEHFNDRLDPPEIDDDHSSISTVETHPTRACFIAEMNRTAARLGMTRTFYRSSFGDGGTPEDRTTCARDLLKLARAGLQNERLRGYVSTPRYETTVTTPDKEQRAVEWVNTNQLLSIEGYDGLKTGTTNQAGSCLVASGHRGDDHLLVVVLGATSNEGRYVDCRNLFRWGWRQRQGE